MINIWIFTVYVIITAALFIAAIWADYKWIPLLLGGLMAAVTVISIFVAEVPPEEYINWITITFWVVMGIAFFFGVYFSVYPKRWWAGAIAGGAIIALAALTLIDILVFAVFPLIPGAHISFIYLIAFWSLGEVGIVTGKTVSDKKHGFCIPFFEDCSKYDCDASMGKCKKE
jgi:hypothetical protein